MTATLLNLQCQEVCSSYIDRINFKVLLDDGNRIVNPQGIFLFLDHPSTKIGTLFEF